MDRRPPGMPAASSSHRGLRSPLTRGPNSSDSSHRSPRPEISEAELVPKSAVSVDRTPRTPLPRAPYKLSPGRRGPGDLLLSPNALLVSSKHSGEPIRSPYYSPDNSESFFDQCFDQAREIGSGSSAKVYRVRCKEDNRVYAVKKSTKPFKGVTDREYKLKEVLHIEQVSDCLHCVRCYRAWEEGGILFIQTEFCEEGSLHLRTFTNETTLWNFLADISLALKHIHDNNILHLDIKPANIFITKNGVLKIGDFGISGMKSQSQFEMDEGDPVYLAPELLSNKAAFEKPADIFSLGVSILELCCREKLPGSGPIWQQIRQGTIVPELQQQMPPRIAQLVLRMIRPNPAKRPTIEEILSHPEVAAAVARRQPLYRELRRQSIKEHLASFWRGMWLAIMLWATMLLAWVRGVLFGRPPHSMAPREVTHDVDSSDDDHLINSPTARLIDFSHAAPPTSTDSLSSRLGLKPGAAATRSSCSRVRDIRSIGNANGKNLMKDFDSAAN